MDDLDRYLAMHADVEVTEFIGRVDRVEAERRLASFEKQWQLRGHGMFAILERARGRFLGVVGLDYWPNLNEIELGWVLQRDAWGRGFATEAAIACANWGFARLSVPYFTSMIRPGNWRSIAVAERVGMSVARSDVIRGETVLVFACFDPVLMKCKRALTLPPRCGFIGGTGQFI